MTIILRQVRQVIDDGYDDDTTEDQRQQLMKMKKNNFDCFVENSFPTYLSFPPSFPVETRTRTTRHDAKRRDDDVGKTAR